MKIGNDVEVEPGSTVYQVVDVEDDSYVLREYTAYPHPSDDETLVSLRRTNPGARKGPITQNAEWVYASVEEAKEAAASDLEYRVSYIRRLLVE